MSTTQTPYGYCIEGGNAILDPVRADQVRHLFTEFVVGGSIAQITKTHQIHRHHPAIGRMLADTRYVGTDYYPAIVDRELWNKAQIERNRRAVALGRTGKSNSADSSGTSPFSGIVFCGECGSEYRRYAGEGHSYYRCSRHIATKRAVCKGPKVNVDSLENAFLDLLRNIDLDELTQKPKQNPIRVEQRFTDPFRQAEYAYSMSGVDDFEFMTAKVLDALKTVPEGFDSLHMRKIIRRITIAPDGTIQFELINHKVIRREMNPHDGS